MPAIVVFTRPLDPTKPIGTVFDEVCSQIAGCRWVNPEVDVTGVNPPHCGYKYNARFAQTFDFFKKTKHVPIHTTVLNLHP